MFFIVSDEAFYLNNINTSTVIIDYEMQTETVNCQLQGQSAVLQVVQLLLAIAEPEWWINSCTPL